MLDQLLMRLTRPSTLSSPRQHSRRALGLAALAGTTLALPIEATAKKYRRRRKKSSGNSCGDRERQRCAIDAGACRETVLRTCATGGGCGYALFCCDQCTATGFITCALGGG